MEVERDVGVQRMRFYDRKNSEWIEMDAQDKEDASLLGHIAKLTGGGRFYLPEARCARHSAPQPLLAPPPGPLQEPRHFT